MHSTVAVQDLKIGMFIRLELGWMSHPFPLSSFRLVWADQIATIRGLGLERVIWDPARSELPEDRPALLPRPADSQRNQQQQGGQRATSGPAGPA